MPNLLTVAKWPHKERRHELARFAAFSSFNPEIPPLASVVFATGVNAGGHGLGLLKCSNNSSIVEASRKNVLFTVFFRYGGGGGI